MATRQILAEVCEAYRIKTGQSVAIESVGGVDAAQLTPDANGRWRLTWWKDGPIMFALFLLAIGMRVGLEARLRQAGGFEPDPRGIYSEAVGLVERQRAQ